MSRTEIFGFDKEGNAYWEADIGNAFRGGMAIWSILEERYLPPHRPSYVPAWIPDSQIERHLGYKPFRCCDMRNENGMKEIWALADSEKTSLADKIVLMTTFDKVLVKKEDLPKVIEVFETFEGETSLKEQALVLRRMYDDENCIAVGWNQTSVNADTWTTFGGYDEEKEEYIPYNCLKQNEHYWIFDEIKEKPGS
jgi:hypothetical protein